MKEGGVLDNVVFDSKCVRQHGVSQHCVVREPGSQGARECNLDSEKWRTVEKINGLARRKGNVVDAAGVFVSVGCPWGVNDVVDCVQPPLTVGGAGLPLGVIPP